MKIICYELYLAYIDKLKAPYAIRIISLNPKGYRPIDKIKVHILIKFCDKCQIDIIILNEINKNEI